MDLSLLEEAADWHGLRQHHLWPLWSIHDTSIRWMKMMRFVHYRKQYQAIVAVQCSKAAECCPTGGRIFPNTSKTSSAPPQTDVAAPVYGGTS